MTSCQCYRTLFPTINPLFQSPVIQSTISNPLFPSSLYNSHRSPLLLTPRTKFMPTYVKRNTSYFVLNLTSQPHIEVFTTILVWITATTIAHG